jgi:hypothetical protein
LVAEARSGLVEAADHEEEVGDRAPRGLGVQGDDARLLDIGIVDIAVSTPVVWTE